MNAFAIEDAPKFSPPAFEDTMIGAAQAAKHKAHLEATEPTGPWTIRRGRPLGSQLLIRKVEFKDQGLIMTPLTANRDTNEAEVIAIGPDVDQIVPGDTVLTRKYSIAGTKSSLPLAFWVPRVVNSTTASFFPLSP